jgi:hypothetical protein
MSTYVPAGSISDALAEHHGDDIRMASMTPADPAPTMMTLYCIAALLTMMMALCWRDDVQRHRLSQ